MKIIIEECKSDEEEQITIRCKELNENLLKLLSELKMGQKKLQE